MDIKLYKGIFWYRDISSQDIICAKIPCCPDGTVIAIEGESLNSKHGDNYNHEKTWGGFPGNVTKGKKYNYYPRGRVEIKNGRAKIFLNPNLLDDRVIQMLIAEFGLCEDNGIREIKVITDFSAHYRCYLDYGGF